MSSTLGPRPSHILQLMLVVSVFSMASFALYHGLTTPRTRIIVAPMATVVAAPTVTATPLKAYASPLEQLAIAYPANWTDNGYTDVITRGVHYEDQQFMSPFVDVSGKQVRANVQFDATDKADPGAVQSTSCLNDCTIIQVVPLTVHGYPPLFIVVGTTGEEVSGMAVTDRAGVMVGAKLDLATLHFGSKRHPGGQISLRISYAYPRQKGDQSVRAAALTTDQYRQTPTLSAVPMAILRSLEVRP